jgi:hypothetical protein
MSYREIPPSEESDKKTDPKLDNNYIVKNAEMIISKSRFNPSKSPNIHLKIIASEIGHFIFDSSKHLGLARCGIPISMAQDQNHQTD